MRRRAFIAGLTGAVAWPLVARAQQPKVPVVGLLNGVSFEGPYAAAMAAIRQGLQETGFVEGQNLAIEYRTADGQYERLPDLASKRLELLLELRPGAPLLGYLDNSRSSAAFETNVENVTAAARIKRRELAVFDAGTEEEIETAFTRMALQRVRALVVGPDPFLTTRQEQIIALAAQSRLPALYAARGAVVLGGLMSYGVLANDMYRLAGIYAGRILKGEIPTESPVMLPTRFELVINNRTAMALRITLPRRLLARADEIIE